MTSLTHLPPPPEISEIVGADERIAWWGRPSALRYAGTLAHGSISWRRVLYFLLVLGFSIIIGRPAADSVLPPGMALALSIMVPIIVVIFTALVILLWRMLVARGTVYAISDRHAYLLETFPGRRLTIVRPRIAGEATFREGLGDRGAILLPRGGSRSRASTEGLYGLSDFERARTAFERLSQQERSNLPIQRSRQRGDDRLTVDEPPPGLVEALDLDEEILWWGRPRAWPFATALTGGRFWYRVKLGFLIFVYLPFWAFMWPTLRTEGWSRETIAFLIILGLPAVLWLLRQGMLRWEATRTIYAVTDERVLILRRRSWPSMTSHFAHSLGVLTFTSGRGKSGSVFFPQKERWRKSTEGLYGLADLDTVRKTFDRLFERTM